EPVGEPALLCPEVGEGGALVLVRGDDARVEHEAEAGAPRVGREEGVLAAVAFVPPQRSATRHGQAERREKGPVVRTAACEVRRLDLEMRDPAPRARGG